jgi:hypothetical protein
VPTIVKGELYAVDLVSVPSNRDALILSAKSLGQNPDAVLAYARSVLADARGALALGGPVTTRSVRALIADAERALGKPAGPARRMANALLEDALADKTYEEEKPRERFSF